MAINWYPGHMNKARREIGEAMGRTSLVIELVDARIPFSSENPLVAELRGDTPCLKILNKADLADPKVTAQWLAHFEQDEHVSAMALNQKEHVNTKSILEAGRALLPADRSTKKSINAMILGVPNVGKSTLINTLAGRAIAKTGNVPAVTKRQHRIPIGGNFVLLDTPGFLWPKLSPEACGYRLAITGAIRDAVIEFEDLAFFAVRHFADRYPDALTSRYKLEEVPQEEMDILEAIAERRGCIGRNHTVNLQKVCELLIREFRQGALGPISLETPADIQAQEA